MSCSLVGKRIKNWRHKHRPLLVLVDTSRNVSENEIISPGRCLLDDCLKCKHRFVPKLNIDGLVDDSDNEEEENEVCRDVTEASGSDVFRKVYQDDCRSVSMEYCGDVTNVMKEQFTITTLEQDSKQYDMNTSKEVDHDDFRGVPLEVGEDVNHVMKGQFVVIRLEQDSVQYDVNK